MNYDYTGIRFRQFICKSSLFDTASGNCIGLSSYPPNEMEIFAPQNDLQEDPNEMNSLYGKPEFEDITLELKKKLQDLRAKYKDDNQEDFSPKKPGQEVSHKALGCEVLHENPYAAKYSAGRANALKKKYRKS